ncbi:MAG: AMP-binding protein [Planctomycetes bacterium]|nr:AMP-binding protein [Planctomycetota bacterium]
MPPEPDLLSLVRAAAHRGGSRPQLTVGDESWSAAAFARAVEGTAAGLLRAGFQPGDRLAVLLERSAAEPIALLAAAAAGGLMVPIHGKLRDDQIAHLLRDSEPFAVVVSRTRLLALREPQRLLHGQRLYWVGEPAFAGVSFADLQSLAGAAEPVPPAGRKPAALLYTSGSTGAQKGIVQDHHNLCLGAATVADYLQLGPDDHLLGLLPLAFDYGLNQLLAALHSGARLTAADHLGPGELAQLLTRVRPTGLAGVPSLWHEVASGLQQGVLTEDHGRSLRYVTNSGGKLWPTDSAVLRQRWPHVQVFAMYGLTEAFRSAYLPPAEFDACPESFGRALPGVELLLVDPATGLVLDGPGTGELVHTGALIAHGYWRNPEATAARFRPDPRGRPGVAVFSGDLVRRDAAGRHYFVARLDRQLKVAGHRASPDEVAAAVRGLPGVGEVAVLGVEAGPEGHRIVLVVAGDPRDPDLVQHLLRTCRKRLPAYLVPSAVHVLTELPHNQNGKIDENALRALGAG